MIKNFIPITVHSAALSWSEYKGIISSRKHNEAWYIWTWCNMWSLINSFIAISLLQFSQCKVSKEKEWHQWDWLSGSYENYPHVFPDSYCFGVQICICYIYHEDATKESWIILIIWVFVICVSIPISECSRIFKYTWFLRWSLFKCCTNFVEIIYRK